MTSDAPLLCTRDEIAVSRGPADHRHPRAELGEVVLYPHDHEGADDWPEHGADAAEERHEDRITIGMPIDVGQGRDAEESA